MNSNKKNMSINEGRITSNDKEKDMRYLINLVESAGFSKLTENRKVHDHELWDLITQQVSLGPQEHEYFGDFLSDVPMKSDWLVGEMNRYLSSIGVDIRVVDAEDGGEDILWTLEDTKGPPGLSEAEAEYDVDAYKNLYKFIIQKSQEALEIAGSDGGNVEETWDMAVIMQNILTEIGKIYNIKGLLKDPLPPNE